MLGINRQKYYRQKWGHQKKRTRAQQVIELVERIRNEQPRIGLRKLHYLLEPELGQLHVGRDKLNTILKANNLLIKPLKTYHKTTNSHHRFHRHKNLIEGKTPERPEEIWVSDITYLGTRESPLYLALVTDSYSKKIVGYDVSESLSSQGALRALGMGIKTRQSKNQLIHHSDRGLQYCCDAYQELLKKNKITPSMTESYDPYANAIAERVNGILKQDFLLDMYRTNLKGMMHLVKEIINIYNTQRPHLSCGMKTPEWMHNQQGYPIRTYRRKTPCKLQLARC